MKLSYRKAVFAVTYRISPITQQIEYLVLHRKSHWTGWEFPKGGIDAGESLWQTTKREVKESGLKPLNVRKYNYKGKYKYPHGFPDRQGIIGQSYVLFSAEVEYGKRVKIDNHEHSEYIWLDFDKAIRKLKHDSQKKALAIVNKSLIR